MDDEAVLRGSREDDDPAPREVDDPALHGSRGVEDPALPAVECVGAVVHDGRGRLLMIRRGTPPHAGSWSLPGGRVEDGESLAEAVVREVAEETGLTVRAGEPVGRVQIPGPGGVRYDVTDLRCTPTHPDAVPVGGDDAADAAFVDRRTLDGLSCTPGLVDTLDRWGVLPR